MITATRKIHFCAGHRVFEHESKCATLHGHNYIAWVTVEAPELDTLGRVVDFSCIKQLVGDWIDLYWDHNTIVYHKDITVLEGLMNMPRKKDPFVMHENPTAENMASFLLNTVCPEVFAGSEVKATKIELYETENCKVEVTL